MQKPSNQQVQRNISPDSPRPNYIRSNSALNSSIEDQQNDLDDPLVLLNGRTKYPRQLIKKKKYSSSDVDSGDDQQIQNYKELEEPIIPYTEQAKSESVLDNLSFSLTPRQKLIKLDLNQRTILPVAVQIVTKIEKQQKLSNEQQIEEEKIQDHSIPTRPPIDLVCVVDVSGSMEGEKLQLVKNSLRFLMKIMGPWDRLSIVTFETRSHIILPWTRNTPENKDKIKKIIKKMRTLGSTNIAAGVYDGLKLLESRKYKNPVSLIFVLSDGQDDNNGADIRCQEFIEKAKIMETYTINTFGYGSDHDAEVMNNIATYRNGNFYYIENVTKASEYFVLSLSGLLAIFAEKVCVKLQEKQDDQYPIHRVYGEFWYKDQENQHEYNMDLNYLLLGDSKAYIFEIELPKATFQQLADNQKNRTIMNAEISGFVIGNKNKFQRVAQLEIILLNQDEQVSDTIVDEYVETNYLRTRSGEVIGQACELAKLKKYDEAIQLINKMINEVISSKYADTKILKKVLEDAEKSKELCKPQIYEQQGQAYMLKKKRNHLQRQASYSNEDDWDEQQQENMVNMAQGNLALSCSDLGEFEERNILQDFDECENEMMNEQQ